MGLYGALEEHYEGKWEKLLDSSSKEEAEKMIGSLSGMSEAVSAVSEMDFHRQRADFGGERLFRSPEGKR